MSERRQRIPAEEIEGLEKWKLPFWTEPKHIVKNEVEEEADDDVLVEEEEIEVEPLTAEQLEAIRQEAYNEGLQQGLVEGRQKGEKVGYEEGHSEGFEAGKEEGRKIGYDAGHGEGAKAAEEKLGIEKQNIIKRSCQILAEIEAQFSKTQKDFIEHTPLLVQAMAEAVVNAELSNGSEHIRHLVSSACDALPTQTDRVQIRVNPLDLPYIEAAQEQGEFTGAIKGDESISAGGCVVSTDYSAVDFTLSNRWLQVVAQFKDLWQLGDQAELKSLKDSHSLDETGAENPVSDIDPLSHGDESDRIQADEEDVSHPSSNQFRKEEQDALSVDTTSQQDTRSATDSEQELNDESNDNVSDGAIGLKSLEEDDHLPSEEDVPAETSGMNDDDTEQALDRKNKDAEASQTAQESTLGQEESNVDDVQKPALDGDEVE